MNDSKQEYFDAIQVKMDKLMNRLKQENDEMLLSHLANAGQLLLSGLSVYDEREGDYQVKIDTYTASKGYQDDKLIYRTDNENEAEKVFDNILETFDNTPIWIDTNGDYSM